MSIEELVVVVPAPTQPSEAGSPEAIPVVERAMGTALPKDVFDFGIRYGTGMFADTVEIYNPFSAKYLESVRQVSDCYRELKHAEGNQFIPYDIYPISPGLLVWGSDVNGHMMFWLTEGQSEKWPLVLMTVDGQFEQLNMSMTTFLARTFGGVMECILWDKEWIKNNFMDITFHPR